MDTSGRNRALAMAAKRLGAKAVAARLSISDTLVHLYAIGEFPVPDAVWMLALHPDTGLLDDISRSASQALPVSKS